MSIDMARDPSLTLNIMLSNTLQQHSAAASVIQYAWRSYRLRQANSQLDIGISSWQELMKRSVQAELILHLRFQVEPLKPFSPDRFAVVLDRRLADCPEDEALHRTFIWKVQYLPDQAFAFFFHSDMVTTIENTYFRDYSRQHLHACRLAVQRCVSHTMFSVFILTIIVLNCVTLVTSIEIPEYESIWVDLEVLFLCVYVLEFILKLVAQGFCSRVPPRGYFTSGWNILDFIVVCEGIISLVIFYSTTNDADGVADVVLLSVLRAVRLLRPLRLVTNIHSLRLMLGAIFKSGLLIGTALFMVGFCFFVLAIPGLALLQGQFRQRCFWSDTGLLVLNASEFEAPFLCSTPEVVGSPQRCADLVTNESVPNETLRGIIQSEMTCSIWQNNPHFGVVNFDNVLTALFAVFQFSTLEGWSDVMAYGVRTSGFWIVIYFIIVVVFGGLFLVNILAGIVWAKFEEEHKLLKQEQKVHDTALALKKRCALAQELWKTSKVYHSAGNKDFLATTKSDHPGLRVLSRRVGQRSGSRNGDSLASTPSSSAVPSPRPSSLPVRKVSEHTDERNNQTRDSSKATSSLLRQAIMHGRSSRTPHHIEADEKHSSPIGNTIGLGETTPLREQGDEDAASSRSAVVSLAPSPTAVVLRHPMRRSEPKESPAPPKHETLSRANSQPTIANPASTSSESSSCSSSSPSPSSPQLVHRRQLTNLKMSAEALGETVDNVDWDHEVASTTPISVANSSGGHEDADDPSLLTTDGTQQVLERHKSGGLAKALALPIPALEKRKSGSQLVQLNSRSPRGAPANAHGGDPTTVAETSKNGGAEGSPSETSLVFVGRAGKILSPAEMKQREDALRSANLEPQLSTTLMERPNSSEKSGRPLPPVPRSDSGVRLSRIDSRAQQEFADHDKFAKLKACLQAHDAALNKVVSAAWFEILMCVLIGLDLLFLITDHYPASETFTNVLIVAEYVFISIYSLELLLKLVGFGFQGYFSDLMNVLDFSLVVLGYLDFGTIEGNINFMGFRALRLLRLFRLVKHMSFATVMLKVVGESMSRILWAGFLLLFFCIIYTIAGMQFFHGRLGLDDEPLQRNNFDSFHTAFVTVFQVLNLENWQDAFYGTVHAVGWALPVVFFVSWIILGQYILLSLFLAIVMSKFEEKNRDEVLARQQVALDKKRSPHRRNGQDTTLRGVTSARHRARNSLAASEMRAHTGDAGDLNYLRRQQHNTRFSSPASVNRIGESKTVRGINPNDMDEGMAALPIEIQRPSCHKRLTAVVHSAWFSRVVLGVILLSCIELGFESPYNLANFWTIFFVFDVVFTFIFVAEAGIKIGSATCACAPGSYWRNSWDWVDFIVVVASIANIAVAGYYFEEETVPYNLGFVRGFRVVRALRPLRFLNVVPGTRTVVNTIFQSVSALAQVGLVILYVMGMFAVLGVQLFKGKLYRCNDPAFPAGAHMDGEFNTSLQTWKVEACNSNFSFSEQVFDPQSREYISVNRSREWVRDDLNFDNFGNALLSLFVAATGEGWPEMLFAASDTVAPGYQPILDNSRGVAFYFLAYVLVMICFLLNLFTGALFDNYMTLQRRAKYFDCNCVLSDDLHVWVQNQKALAAAEPGIKLRPNVVEPGKHGCCTVSEDRAACLTLINRQVFRAAVSKSLEAFILGVIILDCIVMATETYTQLNTEWELFREICAYVVTASFVVEVGIKIGGMGWAGYWRSLWNRYDFFITLLALVDLSVSLLLAIGAIRLLRISQIVARVAKLPRTAKSVRAGRLFMAMYKIALTMKVAAPMLLNVFIVLAVWLYMFAVVGMFMFGTVQTLEAPYTFENIGLSCLTLFRCATGEDWHRLMFACYEGPYGAPGAIIFWVIYESVMVFVLLNMFVMVIVTAFDEIDAVNEEYELRRLYKAAWEPLDPHGTGFVPVDQLLAFLETLGPKYGLSQKCPFGAYNTRVRRLELQNFHGYFYFSDCLLQTHRIHNQNLYLAVPKALQVRLPGNASNIRKTAIKHGLQQLRRYSASSDAYRRVAQALYGSATPRVRAKEAIDQSRAAGAGPNSHSSPDLAKETPLLLEPRPLQSSIAMCIKFKMQRIERIRDEKAQPISLTADYSAIYFAAKSNFYMDEKLQRDLQRLLRIGRFKSESHDASQPRHGPNDALSSSQWRTPGRDTEHVKHQSAGARDPLWSSRKPLSSTDLMSPTSLNFNNGELNPVRQSTSQNTNNKPARGRAASVFNNSSSLGRSLNNQLEGNTSPEKVNLPKSFNRRRTGGAPDNAALERAVQVLSALAALRRKMEAGAARRAARGIEMMEIPHSGGTPRG